MDVHLGWTPKRTHNRNLAEFSCYVVDGTEVGVFSFIPQRLPNATPLKRLLQTQNDCRLIRDIPERRRS